LVPEGVVNLTETAAAIAELVDGTKTAADIAVTLASAFDAPQQRIAADVEELLGGFAGKTWLELSGGRAP
jgi:coenzyme PQQ biosynthesis protein PqqD